MRKWLISGLKIIFFVICMAMIVSGHQTIGRMNLLIMLIGVSGLLLLLYSYNQKFT